MKFRKGQAIYIDGNKYIVDAMIEFDENGYIWQEYKIFNVNNEYKWLAVMPNDEYVIYDVFYENIDVNNNQLSAYGSVYNKVEEGQAVVRDYFGSVGLDKNEVAKYYDYISENQTNIISVEIWGDEVLRYIGMYLSPDRVKTTGIDNGFSEQENLQSNFVGNSVNKTKSIGKITAIITAVIVALVGMLSIPQFFNSKQVENYLKKSSKYTYVTSITNSNNKKKAKVYSSSFGTVDETVKDIIDNNSNVINKTTENAGNLLNTSVGLQTKHEYVYIYQEASKIYVQVSNKKYVNRYSNTYHSSHSSRYYSTYNSNTNSTTYDNYVKSARQSSVSTRSSSGGGLSFGK